ncbi:hypothetical protein AB1Y20_009771 [Prymnesium parvum]|uniref:Chromo domain-containing protein n=1 Tax=Prymnesium parvum TaxID=97485 RepID=A0AB34K1U2_PRYPA
MAPAAKPICRRSPRLLTPDFSTVEDTQQSSSSPSFTQAQPPEGGNSMLHSKLSRAPAQGHRRQQAEEEQSADDDEFEEGEDDDDEEEARSEDDEEHIIERLVDVRKCGRSHQIRVRWEAR